MTSRISITDLAREPFRIFFPAAMVAAIAGISLWPLYYWHVDNFYPGQSHARLMAYGFCGGFILGFLGTALPRMLSTAAFSLAETGVLFCVYMAMNASYVMAKLNLGDSLLLVLLAVLAICFVTRFLKRQDTPPPGFVLVAAGLACAAAGAILAIVQSNSDEPRWPLLQHLLSYQGFVLFPILGISPFILPRFFGLPSSHDFPESRNVPQGWGRKAATAIATATLILASFFLEASGRTRLGPLLRFLTASTYIAVEALVFQATQNKNDFGLVIRSAFILLLTGFAGTILWPEFRVALLHFTLIGGFALIALTVATRVIYGHSGNLASLNQPNRWFLVVGGLICFAMLTRISGDFWPKITMSHYAYGAIVWLAGAFLWAWKTLGKVLIRDSE